MPTALRSALCVVTIAVATMTPLTTQADPAGAAATHRTVPAAAPSPSPTTDFTAGVRSIHHASGTVTFVGTAPVGTSVELAGDVLEPVWTEADGTGSWSASVRVRSGDPHVVRITSPVSGRVIEVPVQALILIPPTMGGAVDVVSRSLDLDGSGHPGARFAIADDGEQIGETDVDPDGHWHFTARDLSFGVHHVTAVETFDGAVNGTVEEDYVLDGAATVTEASASRVTGRVTLAGTAPAGTRLAFSAGGSGVADEDGAPLDVAVGPDGRWQVAFPIPTGARLLQVDVTTHDEADHGGDVVGRTSAHVEVPLELAGTVEQDPDGSWLLAGTGELGGTVSLETEDGTALQTPDGSAVETEIGPPAQAGGYSWRLRVSQDVVPDDVDVVVARQRVHGVEQGALRLVLPGRGHRPGPETGGAGISTGTHPQAPHAATGRLVSGQARLAYTGTELVGTVATSVALGSLGAGLLLTSRTRRRRTRTP